MNTTEPQSIADPQGPFEGAEERIEALRAELEATADKARQSVIQYEIGHLSEHALGNEAQAVREYLAAYNLDPGFRPPLIALVTIFERRRSAKNLVRLYDAQARSATSPREAASAIADRAVLLADQLGEPDEARELLVSALAQAAEAADIALLLEHDRLASGDRAGALELIATRAELVRDPVLATLLRLEVARAKEDAGDINGALAVLRAAVSTPAARWRVLEQLERVARRAERHPERIVALEGRAKLAAAEARGEDQGQASGAFAVQRFADRARAGAEAAALYREAARLRLARLGDAAGARRDYDEALALRGSDPLLHYERMLACELAGELDAAAAEARYLLDAGVDGPAGAALWFRLAENAQASDDADNALAHMRSAVAVDPSSAVAAAMLDDLLRGVGDVVGAAAQLAARAEAVDGPARAQRYWEAAQIAVDQLADFAMARPFFEAAAAAAADPTPIWREMYGAALRLGDPEGARLAGSKLLERPIDAEERGALLRDLHELVRVVLEDEESARKMLEQALADEAAAAWAPDIARLYGIASGHPELAAHAHLRLAERAADAETAAAHLCAAARHHVRANQADEAIAVLRQALGRSASHPYAIALLEEILRARGDADELVRLLREAAESSDAPRAAEARLLLAGAAAEAADDLEQAVRTYEEAADRDPTSLAPALALKRLAENRRDPALLLRALEALSERETALGEPGRHTLALGEHYQLISHQPALAETPLRTVLANGANEPMALHAAIDLAMQPPAGDGAAREEGLAKLIEHASADARPWLLREAAASALASGDRTSAERHLRALREVAPNDRAGALGWLALLANEPERAAERPEAILALAHGSDDDELAAELLLTGLRANLATRGEEGVDDAVILAHEVMAVAPGSLASAIALDETLSAGDDAEGRADALGSWLEHAGDAGRLAVESARGRALAAAGRAREALEVLLRVAARDPDDLASWEAIRVCARECEAWEPLVEACDRLAHLLPDPELTTLLLEESAAVLMDELEQDERAERRLRRVLAIDPRRPIAYGRLHDLLAEREDDAGLLELVSSRIERTDDSEELAKLFYEQARLLRSLGMREDALGALDNLLMLEAEHVGGLALLVELHVQQENFAGAVEALRTLAAADDVPDSQRRIARLGAADFLENKLGDLDGAYDELREIHALGLADRAIYERMASLGERLGKYDEAVDVLARAAAAAGTPAQVARLQQRAGEIHERHRQDREAAIDAYSRALEAVPTELEAGEALAALLDPLGREDLSRRFESAVRLQLESDPTDPERLRKLRAVARWRDDRGLASAALAALVSLELANEEEHDAYGESTQMFARIAPNAVLDANAFEVLRAPGDGGPTLALAQAVSEVVADLDALEPSAMGLGKNDQLKGDHPVRTELTVLLALIGVPAPELWIGGSEPARIDVLPYYKGRTNLVVGSAVHAPLTPEQRFWLGCIAAGLRLGVAPFVRRDPSRAATAIFAAAAAAEVPLAAGEGRSGMAETTRRLAKLMPRKTKKTVQELVAQLPDQGRGIEAWAQLLHRTTRRAGVILASDLSTGLRFALGAEPNRELVLTTTEARELLLFWLSPGALALRQRLGLST